MKKLTSILSICALLLSICIFSFSPATVSASVANSHESTGTFDGFDFEDNGTSITIVGYSGGDTSITVPEAINGKPITFIGHGAFADNASLANIVIPNSVTNIGNNAFWRCTSLTNVTIPNSVIHISSNAFNGCENLTRIDVSADSPYYSSVDGVLYNKDQTELIRYPEGKAGPVFSIPGTVKSVMMRAFSGNSQLSGVVIPNSVTNIGGGVFHGCENLARIDVAPENPHFSSVDGVLYNQGQTELIRYPEGKADPVFTIPGTVKSVMVEAFYGNSQLSGVVIPNSVTRVRARAFSYCNGLSDIYFESSTPPIPPQYGAYYSVDGGEMIPLPKSTDPAFEGIRPGTRAIVPEGATEEYGPIGSVWQGLFVYTAATLPAVPKVVIDGVETELEVWPVVLNGRTLVPLRAIFEEMGASIDWDNDAKTVTAAKGGTVVVLTIGSASPTVNGVAWPIDQPGIVVGGRTLAPLRFVAEAFGGTVAWDGGSSTARITTSG